MTEFVLRALFLLACSSIGYQISVIRDEDALWGILIGLAIALIVIALEILLSKRPVQSISAIVFGLITGSLIAILFYYILQLTNMAALSVLLLGPEGNERILRLIVLLSLAVLCSYMSIMAVSYTHLTLPTN